jgi:hypothetical protein
MQNPTNQAETSIPTENVSSDANLNRTFVVQRKGAKRTEPWYHVTSSQNLAEPWSIPPMRKKPRFEDSLPTATDEAARLLLHLAVRFPPPVADNVDANAGSVADTQSNAGETGRWTSEEDAKLTSAVTNTRKKKYGKGYRIDWDTVAALVPGRTKRQSLIRWHDFLKQSIDRASVRTGKWTNDEDSKLKNAVQAHGDKKWGATAALVPGRTTKQCWNRWHDELDPSIDRLTECMGKWEEEEDIKLKNAVQKLGSKNWVAIAALVPGRTKIQCKNRWYGTLNPSIDRLTGCMGKWEEEEDIKLKNAVQKLGSKNWVAIAALVPGRTKMQCSNRWRNALNPSIALTAGSTGAWTTGEIIKLKAAVETYGGKDWVAIAVLVPGRTKKQCWSRWKTHGPQP